MSLAGRGAVFGFVSNAKLSPDSCKSENSSIDGNLLATSSTVGFEPKVALESRAENGYPSVILNGEGLGLETLWSASVLVGRPRRMGWILGIANCASNGGAFEAPTGGGDVTSNLEGGSC